jgi:hypothetical protein
LLALAAALAALGSLGLSQDNVAKADPFGIPTVAAGVAAGNFNEDDSCNQGFQNCGVSVTVTPSTVVTNVTFLGCTIDAANDGSLGNDPATNPGNCLGVIADSDPAANVFTLTAAVVAGLDLDTINELWQLRVTITTSCLVTTTVTVTYSQDGVNSTTTFTCTGTATPVIAISKIDQFGGLRSSTFLLSDNIAGTTLATLSVGAAPSTNPCISNVTAVAPLPAGMAAAGANGAPPQPCATNVLAGQGALNQGQLPPTCGNVLNSLAFGYPCNGVVLPANTPIRVIEIGAPTYGSPAYGTCTLVEIKLGGANSVTVIPLAQPPVATFDGVNWTVTSGGTIIGVVAGGRLDLTYVNSCGIPGAPNAAGSSIAVVLGGATQGLTNTSHIEIVPAPGSDDDARIDVRVRDAVNIPLPNAHVTVWIDKGALSMRADTTGPAPIGYDVLEPIPTTVFFGSTQAGDTCDQGQIQLYTVPGAVPFGAATGSSPYSGTVSNPILAPGSRQIQDNYTDANGVVSACVYVADAMAPGITPGKLTVTAIVESGSPFGVCCNQPVFAPQNLILTATITVVGPPASIRVAAAPTSLLCGEKATITATVTDAIGQNVSDHTRVEMISNFGATIGGTGATLGFPGVGPVNPLSSSAAETFSGVATAFVLTSTEHVGPYEVVVTSGGSVGLGNNNAASVVVGNGPIFNVPGVITTLQSVGNTGVFSTAPVSAQVTVTCSLPAAAPAAAAPVSPPRTGEGIRPPNTGDGGLADTSGSSWGFLAVGIAFGIAGLAMMKVARR